jgi:hypothetical protein
MRHFSQLVGSIVNIPLSQLLNATAMNRRISTILLALLFEAFPLRTLMT